MPITGEIPGLREAVLRETELRDAAFLAVPITVAGFECAPLTFRHWWLLRLMASPLLTGGTPTPIQLAQFLWVVSVDFQPGNLRARRRFLRRCRRFNPPVGKLIWRPRHRYEQALAEAATVLLAARQYVEDAFLDCPSGGGGAGRSYYSDACYVTCLFGREFGYSPRDVAALPLSQAFQMLKEVRHYRRPESPLANPSDRAVSTWLAKQAPPETSSLEVPPSGGSPTADTIAPAIPEPPEGGTPNPEPVTPQP